MDFFTKAIELIGINLSSAPFIVLALGFYMIIHLFFLKPLRKDMSDIKSDLKTGINNVGKEVGGIKTEINSIYNATRELQKCIREGMKKELLHDLPNKSIWANSSSPLHLNDSGRNLLFSSGAKKMIDESEKSLVKKLNDKNIQTAYDLEKEALMVIDDFISSDREKDRKIKNFLYNNPKFLGNVIDFRDIIFVGSIYLRDKYLGKYPELEIFSVENHGDSNKK